MKECARSISAALSKIELSGLHGAVGYVQNEELNNKGISI